MALRKALTYSKKYARPYTRVSRAKGKSYIKVVPQNKVVKYTAGNQKAFHEGKYPIAMRMIVGQSVQIRDNAIEASRQFLTKVLDEKLPNTYYLQVKVHPHHLLRNNKMAAQAGADRLSSGMSRSFGNIEGRAAIVRSGSDIFVVWCADENAARVAREAMGMIKSKIPGRVNVRTEKSLPIKA